MHRKIKAVFPAITAQKNTANETSSRTSNEVEVLEVLENQLTEFVAQLRGEINKVKGDKGCIEKIFISSISGYDDFIANISDVKDEALALWMTSWSNFGLYDADFGWGKPIWVTSSDLFIEPGKNKVFLIDTKCGQGIEVWVNFEEDDMSKFELHLSEILELF
ncbi:hypothetical protein MKW98_001781 [Papaver atlanticum]|uniref:Uncharacterized protein n=1 Tax=Papaver atlanticum TaxID=357466 RepID=A0AAD4XA70_9MAGN|nr:hypothetical protein MKW98_001781 [Papaver atlanticum]